MVIVIQILSKTTLGEQYGSETTWVNKNQLEPTLGANGISGETTQFLQVHSDVKSFNLQ